MVPGRLPILYYFDADASDPSPRDLSPYVLSNDYATATEGLVHRFASHAVICLDDYFCLYGGMAPFATEPYWYWYGSLESLFLGLSDAATREYAASVAEGLWSRVASLGGDGTPPWQWNQPDGTNTVNIGQVKNAFSFTLDDTDGDAILDAYEYREFGGLEFVDDVFDDPGGDGLCILAEIQGGLDPFAPPEPLAATTNNTAEARLFPSFSGWSASCGETLYERTFSIQRTGTWQQYFLVMGEMQPEAMRVEILYGDATNAFHAVDGMLGGGAAVRLPLVSPDQTNLTIRVVTAEDEYGIYGGFFSCPSLKLVCWVPCIDFPTAVKRTIDGCRYCAAVPDGASRLEIQFTVDWSNPPDGSIPELDWFFGGDFCIPSTLFGNIWVEPMANAPGGVLTEGVMFPTAAGTYPLTPLGPLPAEETDGDADCGTLLVLSPRLTWPGSGTGRTSWLAYDQLAGTYARRTAYPLDSPTLQEAWHCDDDRYCGHASLPTLDLGAPSLTNVLTCSFTIMRGDGMTGQCTVMLDDTNLWEDVVSHYCPDAFRPDGDGGDESGDDCGCDGSSVDGDKAGSCAFRLALGFPKLDTVSGFLWFHSETIPVATPSMLSLIVREGASVTCESNNPGGAISHIRCLDQRGRDITVEQIANGLRIVVSNSASTFLDHSWEIANTGGDLSKIRIRKISRLDNPLSDRTYECNWVGPPDGIFTEQSREWRITDHLTGLVETRIVSDGLSDPGCRAYWVAESKTDATSGKVYAGTESRSFIFGEGDRAVLRETYRAEATFDPDAPRETFSTYWEDQESQFVFGKPRLTYGDVPWAYRAYDSLGREILRISQLDGSPCPADELESLVPESLDAAIAAIPPSVAFSATVTDYAPLGGDSGDDLDASLPRTISEYEIRDGTQFPASQTWTVYNRDGWEDYWEVPVLSVRTERAATPSASFGDPGNAVSTEVSYDIRDGQFRKMYPFLDGLAVESSGEDGVTTHYFTDEDVVDVKICGKWVRHRGRGMLQIATDEPLQGRTPDPARPSRIKGWDALRGTQLLSGYVMDPRNILGHFDFTFNMYDDQDRLRATLFPDGSSTTNAYSCCRLLWSQDRDGRKTVRSAVTGEDHLYYANLETSLGEIPSHDRFGPYADRNWWTPQDARSFRITQHFMDAVGRETNTVTGVLKKEANHNPAARAFSNSNPNAWRSNATVAYPDGVSGHSVSTDARGLVTESFSRDFPDRTESVTYVYDGATSRVVSETDSKSGVTTLHHYDSYGEPTGTTRLGVTSLATTTYVREQGDYWRVTTSVVSNGVKTASSTETYERLTGFSNALRSETISIDHGVTSAVSRAAYNPDTGVLATTTISPTRGTNVVEQFLGATTAMRGPSGAVRHYYDPYGRHYFTERSVPGDSYRYRVGRTEFNSVGDITGEDIFHKRGVNSYSTCHGYDCRGNRIATTNALGGVEHRAYDALGRPVAVWGSAARPTLYSYDTQGRRTSISTTRDPAAADLQDFQDLQGLPTGAWDTTRWRYDPATGLCQEKAYPAGPVVTNTYTADGLVASRENTCQYGEVFTYDANRRLVSHMGFDLREFGYDDFGNRIHSEYDSYISDLLRDDRGAVTNEYHEWPAATIATAYDDYGRIVSRTAGGITTHYAYAPDGLLAAVSNNAFRVDYLYTPDRLDAGYVVTTAGGVQIARNVSRDLFRRHLATNVTSLVDGVPVRSLLYSYDALGRPVSRNEDVFCYNERSEVAETTMGGVGAAYSYDLAGNRATSIWNTSSSVYTANGLNQYETMSSGAVTNAFTYDEWGDLKLAGTSRYNYGDGLLLKASRRDAQGVSHAALYENDAESRRRYKHVPVGFSQPGPHFFAYSGWSLLVEQWRHGSPGSYPLFHYVWGKDLSGTLDGAGGVGGLLATDIGGVWYFPLYDANGNVTDYVSETGQVVASYEYDAFGRTIAKSGDMADAFHFRFSTKYYDDEVDLYYYGYRYYSPELGRWLTRDPIEEDGGDNLYAFCGNNGVNRIDFLGLSCVKFETKQSDGTYIEISSFDEVGTIPREFGNPGLFHKDKFEVVFSAFLKKCCAIKLRPYITYLESLEEVHNSNAYVGYVMHTVVGGKMVGGDSRGTIRPATIAHEKGHAKAYFEVAKPELERQLESYCGKRFATAAEQNRGRKEIQNIIDSIVLSKSLLEVSAKLANEASLNFYNSADYEAIVPPVVPFLPEEKFDYLWRKK